MGPLKFNTAMAIYHSCGIDGPFSSMTYLLETAVFHGYVKLLDGISLDIYPKD